MRPRTAIKLWILAAGLALAGVSRLLVGGDGLEWPGAAVILELRGLRAASAAAVGAALGLAGACLQTLLRNPLASPDLLGMTSGAGLAVMGLTFVAFELGLGMPGPATVGLAALLGASLTLGLLFVLSRRAGRGVDPLTVILVGVIIGLLCAAVSRLLESMLPPDPARVATRWMFGSISDESTWASVLAVALVVSALVCVGCFYGPRLDAMAMGEEEAHAAGVRVGLLRTWLFIASGVLAAGAIVLAGPIGFVGLIAPHAVRVLVGPGHRGVVIGSALAGGAMVVLADALVKAVALPGGRLPIGVVTSLIGGPAFVWLLRARRGAFAD